MNPRRKKRLLVIIAVLFGIGGSIGLVLYALQENINLFYTSYLLRQESRNSFQSFNLRLNIFVFQLNTSEASNSSTKVKLEHIKMKSLQTFHIPSGLAHT